MRLTERVDTWLWGLADRRSASGAPIRCRSRDARDGDAGAVDWNRIPGVRRLDGAKLVHVPFVDVLAICHGTAVDDRAALADHRDPVRGGVPHPDGRDGPRRGRTIFLVLQDRQLYSNHLYLFSML